MQRECEQCGIRSGDLPDLGLEEDEEDVFFEVVKGVTLCVGCAPTANAVTELTFGQTKGIIEA